MGDWPVTRTRFGRRLIAALLGAGPLAVLTGAHAAAAQPAAPYHVVDLGTLPGLETSIALDINARGQVVGMSSRATGRPAGDRAFLWSGGRMVDLGTLGGDRASASAIDTSGRVVGMAAPAGGGGDHAVVWEPGRLTDLDPDTETGSPRAATSSAALGTNDLGQIVGMWDGHPVLWDHGARVVLSDASRIAHAVNARGQIAGEIGRSAPHAVLWDASTMTDLGALGGPTSRADDLNDVWHVVGSAATACGRMHAVLWTAGEAVDLGVLPGHTVSRASAINNHDQIVGTSSATSDGASRAFLWEGGAMTDLNGLLPEGTGWVLTSARGINDLGEIVGPGTLGGQERAFLLTPLAPPGPPPLRVDEPGVLSRLVSPWGLVAVSAASAILGAAVGAPLRDRRVGGAVAGALVGTAGRVRRAAGVGEGAGVSAWLRVLLRALAGGAAILILVVGPVGWWFIPALAVYGPNLAGLAVLCAIPLAARARLGAPRWAGGPSRSLRLAAGALILSAVLVALASIGSLTVTFFASCFVGLSRAAVCDTPLPVIPFLLILLGSLSPLTFTCATAAALVAVWKGVSRAVLLRLVGALAAFAIVWYLYWAGVMWWDWSPHDLPDLPALSSEVTRLRFGRGWAALLAAAAALVLVLAFPLCRHAAARPAGTPA